MSSKFTRYILIAMALGIVMGTVFAAARLLLVLNEQAAIINKVMTDANAKCWGPDGTSTGPCQVK